MLRKNQITRMMRTLWCYNTEPDTGGGGGGQIDWNSYVPEGAADKDYIQNILKSENPGKEIFSQFHNAQKLIGQKSGVPGEGATDEDWAKFYDTIRPKDANEYVLGEPQYNKDDELDKQTLELIKQYRGEDYQKEVKTLMHKYGLTKRQAEGLWNDYEAKHFSATKTMLEKRAADQKALDDGFDRIIEEKFGGSKDKALETANKFIEKMTDKTRSFLPSLSNEALAVFTEIAVNHAAKYDKEDSITQSTPSQTSSSVEALNKEMQGLMVKPEATDPWHPEYNATREKISELSKKVAALQKK